MVAVRDSTIQFSPLGQSVLSLVGPVPEIPVRPVPEVPVGPVPEVPVGRRTDIHRKKYFDPAKQQN